MLKIDRDDQKFSILDTPTLADVSITERYDLQEYICNSPEAFFKEIGLDLFLLGKEIEPSKSIQDRIDILALDKEGACVIIELKRGNHKMHLLQAISYAAMVCQWEAEDVFQLLDEEQQEALTDFLEVDREQVNRQQRIVLVAEAFDYALLLATEWLSEQYGVDIMCCRIAVATDPASKAEYLVCSNVYPTPELSQEAVSRGRRKTGVSKMKWADWDTALASVDNSALVAYYKQELSANRECYLRKRILHFRIDGKRRWFLAARRTKSYVWQHGRFDGDVAFWQSGVSASAEVKPVKNGTCLSFFLATKEDFEFFNEAATKKLTKVEWTENVEDADVDDLGKDT